MSARQICNAALPLKPLIHKTLLSMLIHVSVCMSVRPRGYSGEKGKEREGEGGQHARTECGYSHT